MKKRIDHIGVGVGAVIINKDGKIFLALRGKKAKNEIGKWEVPGGGVEFGETMEETLVREMKEEFNIEIEVIEKLSFYNHIIPHEKQHWIATSFICKLVSGTPEIQEPDKIESFGWFTLEEAEKLNLSVLGKGDIEALQNRFPKGLPKLYE